MSTATVSIPAFLNKLWKMVNDPATDHLISWSTDGNNFVIQNRAQFWYELLPVYYKHNNMSSFVRQLNMYGFHKITTVENGTLMDVGGDRDEIRFYHRHFQKDQPELIQLIKRKVTTNASAAASQAAKESEVSSNQQQDLVRKDEIAQVLSEVRQLRGRQHTVDTQLANLREENSILWRELVLLRQKHMKQQQIVNKLIQFLVTLVQPPGGRGMSVKRPYHPQLMLSESPAISKKSKATASATVPTPSSTSLDPIQAPSKDGPTIHELDAADLVTFADDDLDDMEATASAQVRSPTVDDCIIPADSPDMEDVKSFVNIGDLGEEAVEGNADTDKDVFLNPSTQDTLMSSLANHSSGSNNDSTNSNSNNNSTVKTVAMRERTGHPPTLSRLNSVEDFDLHVESTQNELDQLKDLLNGCSTLDANALLGLFSEEPAKFGLSYGLVLDNEENYDKGNSDVEGSMPAMRYDGSMDFSQLLDDDNSSEELLLEAQSQPAMLSISSAAAENGANVDSDGSMMTPQVVVAPEAPKFPTTGAVSKK